MKITWAGTWTDANKTLVMDQVAKAYARLGIFGLDALLDVPCTIWHQTRYFGGRPYAGYYDPDEHTIYVSADYIEDMESIILHELGHTWYLKHLSQPQRHTFDHWVKRNTVMIPSAKIWRAIKHYNAKSGKDLWFALMRKDVCLGNRLEFAVREHFGCMNKAFPKFPIANLAYSDTPTFRYAHTIFCLPYYPISVTNEAYAEAFTALITDPESVPKPLSDQVRPTMPTKRVIINLTS
jgi:hypothetical protein